MRWSKSVFVVILESMALTKFFLCTYFDLLNPNFDGRVSNVLTSKYNQHLVLELKIFNFSQIGHYLKFRL